MGIIPLIGLLFLSQVPQYSITCDPEQFDYMMENWDQEITIPCTVEYQDTVFQNCTMRIRGDTSRIFRKKSYRIEFPPDQPLNGRTRWNFNADYLDHSYMRAWLFSRVLNDMGFPCFQVSHARLNVNGDYRGLFLLLEPVNESFLARNGFSTTGNLYKAQVDGACANIYDDVDSVWSKKTNVSAGMNDLIDLIQEVEHTSPGEFGTLMDTTFAMYGSSGLIRMLAINSAFANNSTYYHNYYLYNDAADTGRWFMFPWDVDKVLTTNLGIAYGGCTNRNWYDNPVHARTLVVPEFRDAFIDSVETIYQYYLTDEKLSFWVDSLGSALAEAVEADSYDNTDLAGFQAATQELIDNLVSRRTDLEWQFQYKFYPFRAFRSDSLSTGELTVSWSPTQDPYGTPATYTLIVRDSLGPNSDDIVWFSDIPDTTFTITDLPPGDFWWTVETSPQAGWRITEATDRYNPFSVVEPVELSGVLNGHTILTKALSPYHINSEVTVPPDGFLEIEPGVTLLMGEDGAVNCHGILSAQGFPGDSIFFIAENTALGWRGIRAENAEVTLEHVVVSGSRGYSGSPGENFAAVAGHNTDLSVENSVFRNNWSCVKLTGGNAQINDSHFLDNRGEMFFIQDGDGASLVNTTFSNLFDPVASSMDGIEFHLCTQGEFRVDRCMVENIDGDCIDMNASTVLITGTTVSSSTDKGFSVGAPTGGGASGTTVTIQNSIILDCPEGIAVKDGAAVLADNILLSQCGMALHVYEKTSGMGGGFAQVSNSIFNLCDQDLIVEQGVGDVEWSISTGSVIPGEGNTTGDPLINQGGYLLWSSPCINAGDPDLSDPDGSRMDMGPFFYPTYMSGLAVNELMALNNTVVLDDWGRSSDWIELYNGTGYDLDAGVLVFFDSDSSGAEPWSVPRGTMIPSGGFMLFWADGDGWKGGNHLPFRLAGSGDSFSLGRIPPGTGDEPWISVLEEVAFQEQVIDVSIGRFPDGGQWTVLTQPTPGYSNGSLYASPVVLSQPRPNPCSTGSVTIEITIAGGDTEVFVFDIAGRRVAVLSNGHRAPGVNTFHWDTSQIPAGVYLVYARCAGQTPASAKVTVLR